MASNKWGTEMVRKKKQEEKEDEEVKGDEADKGSFPQN
jgi:hypothetical protein